MPMKAAQLAALVDRARQQAPPVVSLPPPALPRQRIVPPAKSVPASPAPKPTPAPSPLPDQTPTVQPSAADEHGDFPIGWALSKDSWQFHRRFFRIFRRPMRRGDYSHLLWQIRRAKAEHLGEDCWRVTLPGNRPLILAVRGNQWRLITILPKGWQPVVRQPAPAQ